MPLEHESVLHFIDGRFVEPSAGNFLDNVDPATGQVYGRVAAGNAKDVDLALKSASKAFPGWAVLSQEERSRILLKIADLIERDLEQFARAECVDTGKPLTVARTVDIPRAIKNFRFFANLALHSSNDMHSGEGSFNYTLRKPHGVVGLISPWNLPLYLLSWKIAPALATGNTAIAKPSELTPMTANLLAGLLNEAGLPPGVLNIVHGLGPDVGHAITGHPDIKAISFTGGTATGRAIAERAAPQFKRLSLELGGKNPTIVFADADFEEAVDGCVRAAFSNQGEICLCGSRIYVEESKYDEFLEALVERVKQLKIGDPLEESTDQGALISQAHRDKVLSYINSAKEEGGTVHVGGEIPDPVSDRCRDGYFLNPAVISGLDSSCTINQEEVFGPVATVMPFSSVDDVIQQANGTPYGLAASIWTSDLRRAHHVAANIDCGIIWINCWMVRDLRTPFGGMKQSGVGREGGVDALRFFTEAKNVCVKF